MSEMIVFVSETLILFLPPSKKTQKRTESTVLSVLFFSVADNQFISSMW